MNKQAKNFAAPSFFGTSGTTPQPNQPNPMIMNQQRGQLTHFLSQSNPQTQGGGGASHLPGQFQFLGPQAQLLVAQAQYAQVQAQAHVQLQSQSQSQAALAHLQSQTHPVVSNLHNSATTSVANVGNVTSIPTTGSARRAAHRPPSRPTAGGSSNLNQSSHFKTVELTPSARGKNRELPEKQVPKKVAALVPESALYTQLLDFEAQMDAALTWSKVDIQEAIRCPPHVQRTLRVYVFNTFMNQTKIDSEKKNGEEASWSLKITGRILEDGRDTMAAGSSQGSSPLYPKFPAFFRRITIYLDQSLYPDDHVIIWDSARSPIQQDGFEVKRIGDREFTARIRIEMNNVPEKFMVSPQLSKLLGIEVETRPRIIAAFWQYVKSRKLKILNSPLSFMCDPSLQRVFGVEKMAFDEAVEKLSQHLSVPQPIHLEHQIKLSGNCLVGTSCYDIQVDVPFPLEKGISAFLAAGLESNKEIEAFDEVISASVKKIHEHRRRRAFFLSFSQSPEEFIDALIASQSKDLKLVAGDTSHNAKKEMRSEFYNQPWVEDAVIRYLNRKTAGSDAPGGS